MIESSIDERLGEFSEYHYAVQNQSDLGFVLITASFLDTSLERIIKAFMVNGRSVRKLFEGPSAPLGTFSSKIEMAYTLGLIDERERNTIQAVRKIRNVFAHEIGISLADPKVSAFFDPLMWAVGQTSLGKSAPFGVLYLASNRVIMQLINRADWVSQNCLQAREWPHERTDADPDWDPY